MHTREQEANLAYEDLDSDHIMLMVTTCDEGSNTEATYLDTGCSNHMIGNKEQMTDLVQAKEST